MIGNTYVTPLLSLMAIACSAPALAMSQPSLNSAVARLAAVSCVVRPAPTSTRPKGSVDVGGGRIYYEVLGDGPPLVLIHDGILHSEVWDSQFGVFAEHYKVIRYDRRGYGRSDPPTQPFSDVTDLHTLLEHVGAEHAVLVGSSSGGGLAIDYTLAHPERVDALVLVGAVVGGMGYSSHFWERGQANFADTLDATIDRWVDDQYSIAPGNEAARRRAGELLRANPQNLSSDRHRYAQRPDSPALKRLAEIRVPTLLVTAEADIPDVHAHAGAIETGIPDATRVVLSKAGHLVYLEQPEAFNRTVLEFLSRADLQQAKTGFVKVSDAELYYEELGEGDPVVLIHGGALDCRMWDDQFRAFARHYRVIRYDVRGLGRSKSPPGAYSDHGDLYALLKHLGIRKTAVIGLSLGGRIAIDFTLQHPEMVTALMPVAPGLSGYDFNGEDLQEDKAGLVEAFQREDYDQVVEFFQRSWTDGPHRAPSQIDPNIREKVRVMAVKGVRGWAIQQHAIPLQPPAIGRLDQVEVPTLAVVGELDMSDIHAIVDLIVKDITGSKKTVVPGVAHMVNMEQPAEFNRIVLEFLARD